MSNTITPIILGSDTFASWVNKTNSLISSLNSEVLTANSTLGITGSPGSQVQARLFGGFTANTLSAVTRLEVNGGGFSANTSRVVIAPGIKLQVSNGVGSNGQVLTSDGTQAVWTTLSGTGTVTQITTPSTGGLIGGTITTTGSLTVRPGDGIVVDSRGVSVNTAYIATLTSSNANLLQNKTWESPGTIGSSAPSTGAFTYLTATTSVAVGASALIDTSGIYTTGVVDARTATGGYGVRVRGNAANTVATIQITNAGGSGIWGTVNVSNTGNWDWSGDGSIAGVKIGYRNVPQLAASNSSIDTDAASGKHFYSTSNTTITMTVPTDSTCPVGTTITFVNGAVNGNISLAQGSNVAIILAGTTTSGNRTIGPGGVATILKVETNKWIVSGVGVV